MIRVRLNKDYHSPQSGAVLYRRGWQNVPDKVSKTLLAKGYLVVQEDDAEGQQEPVEEEENVVEGSFREEVESPESKFVCCGNDWKNQGRLNFHRRSRACPQNPREK